MIVSDPERSVTTLDGFLNQLFGLTAAEARLVEHLLKGETLNSTADLLGVSRNTVRTQIKAVLHKTGTASQPELMRLLLRAIPPAR